MKIFHITDQKSWDTEKHFPEFSGETLLAEGFIHCCTSNQIEDVLGKWFAGKKELVLLEIDINLLSSPIKYENLDGGEELFPHIYGPINNSAIISEKNIE